MGKNLWTEGAEGEPISIYCAFNELDEARFVVNRIKAWQDNGGALNDCAILYRSNAQSRVLEEALLQTAMPYRIYGGMRFFERQEIKDALAYLRLIANRNDDAAFERVVNTPNARHWRSHPRRSAPGGTRPSTDAVAGYPCAAAR
ncbi:DNA helicase II [Serratia fonticola]|uniref:DNA 3'-5' helicase II n=1 Tax=Serratia fonticola TaxID=47917 RepID=A0A4U9W0I8_SERFO|nr:DNA helicase II [Serratia fonticola]